MKEDINDGKRAKVYSQEWYPANAEANASSISDLMSLASPDRSVGALAINAFENADASLARS